MNRKGFTLVEVIIILAVIAILAAIAVPVALKLFERTAEDATREEMDNIEKAIIGDSQKLQSSFRSDFGFLGDIGCLPTVLDRLLTADGLPPFTFDSSKQTGAGWKGPYITGTPGEEFKTDQWGIDYTYTVSGACPLTATLTSNGPDGKPSTGDEITISIVANETTATVRGTVKDTAGVGLEDVPVEIYSSVNGVPTTTTATTDANGQYVFITLVPFGPRGVRALPRLVYSPGSATTANIGTDVIFKVVNYSTSAFTVDLMSANFGPDLAANPNYDVIRIDGTAVDPAGPAGNNMTSTQSINVTNTAIPASPVTRPSTRVFIDSPDVQLPDIVVTGAGTVSTIILGAFNADMRGAPFTVTFTDTGGLTSIVKFTP